MDQGTPVRGWWWKSRRWLSSRKWSERKCREREWGASAPVAGQSVTHSADGLDGVAAERFVDFASQVAYVDLDDVGVAVVVGVPNRSGNV
jgi:hypothetical protein